MDKTKNVIAYLSFIVFVIAAGFTIYKWVEFDKVEGGGIFLSFLALSCFFNWITWGSHDGGGDNDELDRHIETHSAKIGYFVLMVLSSLILFITEGVSNLNDIKNYPLLIVVGLTFVTLPITEFLYSKRFK